MEPAVAGTERWQAPYSAMYKNIVRTQVFGPNFQGKNILF